MCFMFMKIFLVPFTLPSSFCLTADCYAMTKKMIIVFSHSLCPLLFAHVITVVHHHYLLGRSPTEVTRLRFDQEKSQLHLIHGESTSHRGRAGGRSAITN
jgi:hypothetical protein